jgi:signal transduction histidine kinase
MTPKLRGPRFPRIFLAAIGLVTLVIFVLSANSLMHERERLIAGSSEDIRKEGKILAGDIERRALDLASECLDDPDLKALASSPPQNSAEGILFGARVRELLKRHPIADNFFLSIDGNLVFPQLVFGKVYSAADSLEKVGSQTEMQFFLAFRQAEKEFEYKNFEKAISLFGECSAMPVSDGPRAQALERLARSCLAAGKPTDAVRIWHRLESDFGDQISESGAPYAIWGPSEIDKLAAPLRAPAVLHDRYLDLVGGRWQLSADVAYKLKSGLEKRLGLVIPQYEESWYLRQLRIAGLVGERVRIDILADPGPVRSGSVLEGGREIPIFYSVLQDSKHRRVLSISVQPDWIAAHLLKDCIADLKSASAVVSSFQIGAGKPTEKRDLNIRLHTPFPFLELYLPAGAIARGTLDARIQVWLVAGSGGLMLCLLALITSLLIQVSKEQLVFQARSDFLGHISHELKTPLTLILLYAEMLSSDKGLSEEERANCIQIVTREGERLKYLIDNLLHLSRIERASVEYKMFEGDFGKVIEKTAGVCSGWLEQQDIKLTTKIAPNLPPVIFDQEKISQALINLVENARKYGDSRPIEIRLWAQGSSVVLEVEDHGIGIPEAEQEKVFDQYYRATNAGSQRGSGLGLFLIRETVRAHKGSVELKSKPGKGSCFRLTFPASATGMPEKQFIRKATNSAVD